MTTTDEVTAAPAAEADSLDDIDCNFGELDAPTKHEPRTRQVWERGVLVDVRER